MGPAASDEILEFIDFLRTLGDRVAAVDRRGAALTDIERLETLAGRSLPPLYRGFLREFGERSLVPIAGDGSPRIADVIRHARTRPASKASVVIGAPAIDPPTLLVYGDDPAAPPHVARTFDGDAGPCEAPTFAHHLYRCGWLIALGPNRSELTVADGDADELARSAERAGFERLWFSGGAALCLEDGVVRLHLAQEGPIVRIAVLARTEAARAPIVGWFERRHCARRL